jgi:hypothetical protein
LTGKHCGIAMIDVFRRAWVRASRAGRLPGAGRALRRMPVLTRACMPMGQSVVPRRLLGRKEAGRRLLVADQDIVSEANDGVVAALPGPVALPRIVLAAEPANFAPKKHAGTLLGGPFMARVAERLSTGIRSDAVFRLHVDKPSPAGGQSLSTQGLFHFWSTRIDKLQFADQRTARADQIASAGRQNARIFPALSRGRDHGSRRMRFVPDAAKMPRRKGSFEDVRSAGRAVPEAPQGIARGVFAGASTFQRNACGGPIASAPIVVPPARRGKVAAADSWSTRYDDAGGYPDAAPPKASSRGAMKDRSTSDFSRNLPDRTRLALRRGGSGVDEMALAQFPGLSIGFQ